MSEGIYTQEAVEQLAQRDPMGALHRQYAKGRRWIDLAVEKEYGWRHIFIRVRGRWLCITVFGWKLDSISFGNWKNWRVTP